MHVVPNSKGVFFYIHGGGLVIGDKEGAEQNVYLNAMMDAGYSTVIQSFRKTTQFCQDDYVSI